MDGTADEEIGFRGYVAGGVNVIRQVKRREQLRQRPWSIRIHGWRSASLSVRRGIKTSCGTRTVRQNEVQGKRKVRHRQPVRNNYRFARRLRGIAVDDQPRAEARIEEGEIPVFPPGRTTIWPKSDPAGGMKSTPNRLTTAVPAILRVPDRGLAETDVQVVRTASISSWTARGSNGRVR